MMLLLTCCDRAGSLSCNYLQLVSFDIFEHIMTIKKGETDTDRDKSKCNNVKRNIRTMTNYYE